MRWVCPPWTRGRDFPRQARPPPRCPQLCDNKCALPQSPGRASATRNHPQIAALSSRPLDRPARLASTTVSRGPSWPRSIAEQKASQSLPALEAPISNRQCRRPRGGGPEVFLVVHVPGLASAHRWALPEARHGQQSTWPAPDAVPLFPPSFEHAFHAARGCVCPLGLPARLRSYPRHRPGLSVRGGPMRVDGATTSEPIHQMARGQTSPPMPKPRPKGRPASPPPWLQKCTDGPDQPVSFLRPTELASADALADESPG